MLQCFCEFVIEIIVRDAAYSASSGVRPRGKVKIILKVISGEHSGGGNTSLRVILAK